MSQGERLRLFEQINQQLIDDPDASPAAFGDLQDNFDALATGDLTLQQIREMYMSIAASFRVSEVTVTARRGWRTYWEVEENRPDGTRRTIRDNRGAPREFGSEAEAVREANRLKEQS